MSETKSPSITRQQLIELLNEDLAREYQAIIAYNAYSQLIKGEQYAKAAKELERHAQEELANAATLTRLVHSFGGKPCVAALAVKSFDEDESMLRFDLDNENDIVARYHLRITQCEELGENGAAEQIRAILKQHQMHQVHVATFGVALPDQ